MKRSLIGILCLSFVAALPLRASASATSPTETVHCFFAALARHDYTKALSVTAGPAETALASLLGTVDREASRAHAKVELVVKDLRLKEQAADRSGRVAVEAHYDLAVFGKRSIFRVLVRHLVGTTKFVVADRRIVSFDPLLIH